MPNGYGALTGGLCTVALLGASLPGSDLDGLSAQQIADRSKKALDSAASLRLTLEQGGDFPFSMDLMLDEDNNCAGSIDRGDEGSVELVKRGEEIWMKPDTAFWKHEVGGEQGERVAKLFKDRYIKGSTSDPMLAGIAGACDMDSFRAESDGKGGAWSKGAETTVKGQPTVPITRNKDGSEITLFVAAEGTPYPLKVERKGGPQQGTLLMSDYGKPLPKGTPSAEESVDVGQLEERMQEARAA